MGFGEYALLLIVAVCVIALIYINKKSGELGGEAPPGPGSATDSPPSTHRKKEKPVGPPQNTIYVSSSKTSKRSCPFCDGENSVGAEVCEICGEDI